MTSFIELYVDKGCSFNHIINLQDDINNEYLNIAGYQFASSIRENYYSDNASANITCTISNPATGEVTLSLTPEDTASLDLGRYVFDIISVDTAGTVSKILEGYISLVPTVTVLP